MSYTLVSHSQEQCSSKESVDFFFNSQKPLGEGGGGKAGDGGGGERVKKMLRSFLAAVLLSASVERFFVSRMWDVFSHHFVLSCDASN